SSDVCSSDLGWSHRRDGRQRGVEGDVAQGRIVDCSTVRLMIDSVQFEQRRRLGVATLNRPKALNALTLEMVRSLDRQIAAWESDRSVHAVMLRGEGRAFCAGGDVRAVHASRHHPPGPGDYKTELFREEFHLMRRIHRFRKPWVALTHGITMGGGAGLSVNGSHCVASETTVFAMPEVFIGSFPDVAATRFLGRTPGKIGLFLSLTGARADAADALSAMDRASPLSLKLALRVNQEGSALEIEDALTLEYRAMMHVIAGPDFYEGVRAVLIDKDQKPRWRHSSLADVSEAEVESHFENLGDRELRFEVDGSGEPMHAGEARP